MKQTAVEWLEAMYIVNGELGEEEFEHAKEMEKENIINVLIGLGWTSEKAEQYYNETFKSE